MHRVAGRDALYLGTDVESRVMSRDDNHTFATVVLYLLLAFLLILLFREIY